MYAFFLCSKLASYIRLLSFLPCHWCLLFFILSFPCCFCPFLFIYDVINFIFPLANLPLLSLLILSCFPSFTVFIAANFCFRPILFSVKGMEAYYYSAHSLSFNISISLRLWYSLWPYAAKSFKGLWTWWSPSSSWKELCRSPDTLPGKTLVASA